MIDRAALLGGVPMKALSLIMLTFQNSALILIMHYSRIMPLVNGHRYFTSTSVFLNEVIKLGISATMALYDLSSNMPPNTPATSMITELVSTMFANDSWKLAVPAALYTLQNSLQYVAVSNLDPSTFQVTYQLKILTTAIFSVIMLGRRLTVKRWCSLGLLMLGVAIVQLPQDTAKAAIQGTKTEAKVGRRAVEMIGTYAANAIMARSGSYEGIKEDKVEEHPEMNRSVGLMAVLIACALSGLAGVCFEKVLKQSPPTQKPVSLWIRNCQLSFWSLFPAFFIGVLWVDGEKISKAGFFAGYNFVVWTAIMFQAGGGIIVALVINYADNIAKNFATSISIIVSAMASAYFFDFEITITYLIGTSVVMGATYLYSQPDYVPPPTQIAEYEETAIGRASEENESARPLMMQPLRKESVESERPGSPTEDERQQFLKRGD
ncbi:nucleotide-sugar transporter [Massarina eburnea CBS 473.64]|uniref:Nucleotide-sugar transporter n=1 Tax=Massarina eburnea CBS 473.64 TaxID=1395130 RepID=A0A6A6S8L5_9PLEO|nr:nucleotide-sugar transporter [Massarina eburnea CBS 473.64]